MNSILIITGGEVNITSSLQYTKAKKYSKIIAADGGLESAERLGLKPDVIIGDFDTVAPGLLERYIAMGCETVRLNPEKNLTDTDASYEKAVELGAEEIDFLGAVGSRFDHSYANLFLLKKARLAGIEAHIVTELCRISVIEGDVELRRGELYGKYISLIPFDGSAYGVTLEGMAYPLSEFDFDTAQTYGLGVSNELRGERGRIHIREGFMLFIEAKEDKA